MTYEDLAFGGLDAALDILSEAECGTPYLSHLCYIGGNDTSLCEYIQGYIQPLGQMKPAMFCEVEARYGPKPDGQRLQNDGKEVRHEDHE